MFLQVGAWLALVICLLGLAYKVRLWLTLEIGDQARGLGPGPRAAAALAGLGRALIGPRLPGMLAALFLDGLLQRRSWRRSRLAWLAHICLYLGFMGLLFLHALGPLIFKEYYATLNPFLFLRDLFGLLAIVGVGLAIWRRRREAGVRAINRGVDRLALGLLAVIMLSGLLLSALKIDSFERFDSMVTEYSSLDDPADIEALRAYWASDFGVVFPDGQGRGDAQALARGRELHQESCAGCHDAPQWSFVSYGLGRALAPAAPALTRAGLEQGLWYLHVLACLLGLAILPFSKFLHLFTGPLLLMVRAATQGRRLSPANQATLRALELDTCMHCGACSAHCSVGVALRSVGNLNILPSEKLGSLMRMAGNRGARPGARELALIRQGSYICTSCLRCTELCPVGINLQDLWFAMKEDLARAGLGPEYQAAAQAAGRAAGPSREKGVVRVGAQEVQRQMRLSPLAGTFDNCFRCMTCSNACPVVRMHEHPMKTLDLMPHQIMHALGLGMKEEAMGARMVWNCLTCYLCQEACPQMVRVADILFELRNLAATQPPDLEV